jgi:nucleotide-binding universal stress UspA family protein
VASVGFEVGCDGPSVLVVGVDGSNTSWRALYYAFGQARRQGGRVVAVFAIATTGAYNGTLMNPYDANVELAGELKHAIRALADEYHVATRFICLPGDPVATLTKVAVDQRADAIVLGASEAFGHRLFGSKALRAVRRGRFPITVIP